MTSHQQYDIIMIGTGLAGTTLATILAKHGLQVLMLEKDTHPRFAVGESMTPFCSLWLWIMGERYGIPEIQHLSHLQRLHQHVSPMCGMKRTLGFLYHREGKVQDPGEAHKMIPAQSPFTFESHLYRPDVDLYMLQTAIRYGAAYREKTDVTDIECDTAGVLVQLASGAQVRAQYLIDGSGYKSLLATRFGLREEPPPLKTDSRSIFTHVSNFTPYDATVAPGTFPTHAYTWHEGTLHHVFDGGWFWIIPFGNHPQAETTLCSVGLTLDRHKYPTSELPPAEEFATFVRKFPSIARHLDTATSVRPWVGTGRLQYAARHCVGPRYFLLNHASGFIDPLYSQGLANSFETDYALAEQLLAAFAEADFSRERFAPLEEMQHQQLVFNDQMVYNAYRAMGNFATWNAWAQFWVGPELFNYVWVLRSCLKYVMSGDMTHLRILGNGVRTVTHSPLYHDIQALYDEMERILDQVDAEQCSAEEGGDRMLTVLRDTTWLPKVVYPWGDPHARHGDFTLQSVTALMQWGKTEAPPRLRAEYFDFDVPRPA